MKTSSKSSRKKDRPRTPKTGAECRSRRTLILSIGAALLAVLVFLPAVDNEFVNYDDVFYILNNPRITPLNAENVGQFFTSTYFGNYQPLTLLSLAFDYGLGGPNPRTFHLGNVLLHAVNSGLVFWFVCLLMNRRRELKAEPGDGSPMVLAGLVAALFAVHTIHVESVAWASQRKDVLYTAFYLVSLIAYLKYTVSRQRGFLFASLLLFVCSAFSKAMAVSLPPTLLAMDYYLGRWAPGTEPRGWAARFHLREKIPFFLVALGLGILATVAHKSQQFLADTSLHAPWLQGLYACYGFMQYFLKMAVPVGLSAYYPYPDPNALPLGVWLAPLAAVATLLWLVWSFRRHHLAVFGFLFFLVNVGPVLQLIPVGNFYMADRFMYLPSLGIFIMMAAGGVELARRSPIVRKTLAALGVAYLLMLGVLTVDRTEVWRDSLALWNDVLGKYPDIALALSNRGTAKGETGDFSGAIEDFDRAIAADPDYVDSYCNRGLARLSTGDFSAAIADYDLTLSKQPGHQAATAQRLHAYFQRGVERAAAGDNRGAVSDFSFVVRQDPNFPNARKNLQVVQRRLDQQ